MVHVYVGPNKSHFVVPRNMLCSHSAYCNRLLNGPLAKTYGNEISLEHDEPDAFDLLFTCMKLDSLALDILETAVLVNPDGQKALRNGCHLLCETYCLCFKIQVVRVAVGIMEKLHLLVGQGSSLPFQPRTVRTVLMKLPKDSTLYEYVLQEVANDLLDERGHNYDYYHELLEGPRAIPGLVKNLFIRMKKKRNDEPRDEGTSRTLIPANSTGR